ncbi:MAG: ThuA domain-containing protein, partial [Pirellulaceae bacterium]|nr:ThuA domain-containing protein [Pirellulaceae bacterium]
VRFFTHQIKTLEIHEGDAITDSAEAFYLMEQRGIDNVIVMGVHTNMCVLGRPFSIRQLKYQGKNVVLMRDMTDSMYNPAQAPYVSHFNGTELVIEHIEKYWCPTITSADILGGEPFRFPRDKRPRAVLVIGEKLYETGESLPRFAIDQLGKDFHIDVVHANPAKPHEFPGLETLATADVLILSVRRRALSERQMRLIRGHIDQGKPVVALRTSSHAFGARGEIPAGHVQWEEFDSELLGGDYTGHFANDKHPRVTLDKSSSSHAILAGIRGDAPWTSPNSLYKSTLIAKSKPLAWGAIAGQPRQPVAWVRQSQKDGRVFYTSLGGPGDFANDNFRLLLRNGVYWAAGLETPGTLHQPEKPAKKAADQGGGC